MSFSSLRAEVQDLLARGDAEAAWQRLLTALEPELTTQACVMVAAQADKFDLAALGLASTRAALLGSFTLEPLVPLVKALGYRSRLAPECYVGGFNAWQSEALNGDGALYRFQPDVIFLAVRADELAPPLVHDFAALEPDAIQAELDRAQAELEGAIAAIRSRSPARIVVHNFAAPVHPTLGILDANHAHGQQAVFSSLNERLRTLAANYRDVWLLDAARLQAEIGHAQWFDARLWGLARLPLSARAQLRLADECVRFLRAFHGASRKVLALDLDNVLWGGILGEDGADGIQLGTEYPGSAYVEFQRAVLDLHQRGVLLAIVSKNDEAETLRVLESHPAMLLRPRHFAAWRINWEDKAQNLVSLAEELNLKLDSFVFADDSPVEVERVRSALPAVMTVQVTGEPAARAGWLRGLGVFDTLTFSAEDRARGALYAQEAERKRLQSRVSTLEEFYRSLDMELSVSMLDATTLERAAQLTQRTNQFNLTTRRYTPADLAQLRDTPGVRVYLAQLRDRFGDSGIIGLAITRSDSLTVMLDTFLLSCRVVGRGVEGAFLAYIVNQAQQEGQLEIVGEYIPTRKNQLAADFLSDQGFTRAGDGAWHLSLTGHAVAYPEWIRVHAPFSDPSPNPSPQPLTPIPHPNPSPDGRGAGVRESAQA